MGEFIMKLFENCFFKRTVRSQNENNKNRIIFSIKNVFLYFYFLFYFVMCSQSGIIVSRNGITVESVTELDLTISPHPISKYRILYNSMIICSNCGAYFISPDSKVILYLERPRERIQGEKVVVFFTESKKKQEYSYLFTRISPSSDPSEIEWGDNTISLKGNPYEKKMRYTLYLNEGIIEIVDTKSEIELFEYFLFLLKVSYQKINIIEKINLNEYFKDYVILNPGGAKYENILNGRISADSWNRIGKCCFYILNHLKDRYPNSLVFEVFNRSFKKFFIESNNSWSIDKSRFY